MKQAFANFAQANIALIAILFILVIAGLKRKPMIETKQKTRRASIIYSETNQNWVCTKCIAVTVFASIGDAAEHYTLFHSRKPSRSRKQKAEKYNRLGVK